MRAFAPCATPRILYTCSVPDELDHQSALHALDLAHRWQVDVVVAILSDLLAGVGAGNFGVNQWMGQLAVYVVESCCSLPNSTAFSFSSLIFLGITTEV